MDNIEPQTQKMSHIAGNTFGVFAMASVLIAAFTMQLKYGDAPCPLCTLQRIGFVGVGMILMMNLRFGPRASHYGLTILMGIAGFIVSAHQVLLNIQPGDPGFGTPIFGVHYYTWAGIIFALVGLTVGIALLFDGGFQKGKYAAVSVPWIANAVMWLFIIAVTVNLIGIFFQFGFAQHTPDDQNAPQYMMFNHLFGTSY